MSKIKMKAKSFKKMEDPVNREEGHVKYVCYVQANSIPEEMLEWMETNPRQQNMQTVVAKAIVESLKERECFHELNRGIVLSASNVSYDNKEEEITVEFNDVSIHGDIDGGHTLRAIINLQKEQLLEEKRYVYFEIFTGIDSPVDLALARNVSNQVDTKSIQELERNFEIIKEAVEGLTFVDKVSYKMYEQDEQSIRKPIDVREIIAILMMFCQIPYPCLNKEGGLNDIQPIQCYTGKEATLKKFVSMDKVTREKEIKNMESIIPDIFKIWDKVETEFNDYAKKINRRYLTKEYAKYDKSKIQSITLVSQQSLHYIVPRGLIYPMVAAFRSLIQIDKETSQYAWVKDPLNLLDKLGSKLVGIVLDEKADSPEYIGKSSNLWNNLFKEVYIEGHLV